MPSQRLLLLYLVVVGTITMTSSIVQQSNAQTTTNAGTGGNSTTATTTNTTSGTVGRDAGINATTNRTVSVSPTIPIQPGQQPLAFSGGQFKIKAFDTRFPGSHFTMVVNSTSGLRNIISDIAQLPVTGFYGQGPISMPQPSPSARVFSNDRSTLMYVDQIVNDILRIRALSPMTSPPGIPSNFNPISGSLCYDISWFHVCVEPDS